MGSQIAHNVCWDSHITWFLVTVVSTCILGVTCVLFVGAVVLWLGSWLCPSWFFRPIAFQFPVNGGGCAYQLAVCFCFCFASCFSSVSTKLVLLTGSWVTVLTCGKETFQPSRGQLKCDGTRAGTGFVFRRNGRVHLNFRHHASYIYIYIYMRGKAMANYSQELVQDAMCQSSTRNMTGLWFLPTRPLRLNTNEWMNIHIGQAYRY